MKIRIARAGDGWGIFIDGLIREWYRTWSEARDEAFDFLHGSLTRYSDWVRGLDR